MKRTFLILFFVVCLSGGVAFAEESPATSLWLNGGPQLYKSSHFVGKDFTVRPELSFQVRFSNDFIVGAHLNYYEYPSRNGEMQRWSFGGLGGYDFIRNRLRLLFSLSMVSTSTGGFDDAGSAAFGTRLLYFHPIAERWRLYAGIGGEYIAKVRQRHDTSSPSLKDEKDSCWLFCSSKDEKPTHLYVYNNIPATREVSASLGISYAFQ